MPLNAERICLVALAISLVGCGGSRPQLALPVLRPFDGDQSASGQMMPDRFVQGRRSDPDEVPLPPGAPVTNGPRGTSQSAPGEGRYDAVGYASWYGEEMGNGVTASGQPFNPRAITAAHPTLPIGTFVEVTSLDTGKTILVVVTDRGPRAADRVIDLSRGAAQLLGTDSAGIAAVRVRRVDPSAPDQAALREGRSASPRIDTPPVLLAALRKRLPPNRGRPMGAPAPAPAPAPVRAAAGAFYRAPGSEVSPRGAQGRGGLYVQVAALSSRDRAEALARSIGGSVVNAGAIYRVRTGPFPDAATAARARDAIAGRGYADARIVPE